MKIILTALLLLSFSVVAIAGGDETAAIQEKEFKFKDFTLKGLRDDDKKINLREFAQNKKLVLVVYYAPWCPNWHREMPLVKKLYDKYNAQGFDVIAVSEYDSLENARKDAEKNNLSFVIVAESESQDARQKTAHYEMRKAAGDARNWGSPWNVFLEPNKIEKKGEILMNKAFVVNGEMIETEVEAFIRQKLGLASETKQTALTSASNGEACQMTELKKPE